MHLEAAIREGRFPKLTQVLVSYNTDGREEDDGDSHPVPSLLRDLVHQRSTFPTVSVTVLVWTRFDMQRLRKLYIDKAHAGPVQGIDIVVGGEMQVVVESRVPGGEVVKIWKRMWIF
ncbi:hypothetical protein M427DRAFT_383272 [Gonapodya prolifera JEL478]|uniref:Uncharacterized protein n=1 Tax=Gonapodya prolifera (strain JEL478) TaxID=1344416 RepID=A0A139A8P3_GONPJ|nr:hypothetical protein M427DRAFT_383272 [Gonapodya prolifera JEL478]|eukprot:KXS13150.1 hypothetical protein M427DRAFT_383272 [Gonapodya prolifera JEL478]